FTVIALINVSCAPLLSRMLVLMEFISLGTLSLTITLSLYFTIDDGMNLAAENVLAIVIISLNTCLIVFFLYVASRKLWPAAFKVTTSTQLLQKMFSSCCNCIVSRPQDKAPDNCDMEKSGKGSGRGKQRLVCWPILSCCRIYTFARVGTSEAASAGGMGGPPSAAPARICGCTLDSLDTEASDRAADTGSPAVAPSGMGMALASVSLEDQLSNECMESLRQIPRPSHVSIRLESLL
ncbi:hypothetical protein VaNZ11_005317, partial [Volvox africanus]